MYMYLESEAQWCWQEFVMGGGSGSEVIFGSYTFPSDFYPKLFFSSAKISDDLFFSHRLKFSENLAFSPFFFHNHVY